MRRLKQCSYKKDMMNLWRACAILALHSLTICVTNKQNLSNGSNMMPIDAYKSSFIRGTRDTRGSIRDNMQCKVQN